MSAAHANWSPSGFESLMLCPGKKVMELGKFDNTSIYAAEGTAAHQVLTWALQQGKPAAHFIGITIGINDQGRVIEQGATDVAEWAFGVDDEMAAHVQVCVDYVADLAGPDGVVIVDTRVNFSEYLGVPEDEGWGTADVIILRGDEIIVIDFKYGRGVEVSAEANPQMSLYALGALFEYGQFQEFTRVRMAISQPRAVRKPSEYDITVAKLEAWGIGDARTAVMWAEDATRTYDGGRAPLDSWIAINLRPGEKQCRFCKAKATCPKLRDEVLETAIGSTPATVDEFEALMDTRRVDEPSLQDAPEQWLAACLGKVDLIEDWCKAVRAETERRLLAGDGVPGYKLVPGKKGNRAWSDASAVEEALKSMRLKESEMYDFKLISPTTADKLAKAGTIGPRQWPKLQALITQSTGKPHVAPESDPRPALVLTAVADEFENVAEPSAQDFA